MFTKICLLIGNISWLFRHICDSTWQCPNGEDEMGCHQHNCIGLFSCLPPRNHSFCLHPTEICDGFQDCPKGEDEYLCELPGQCPVPCQCLMYGMYCADAYMEQVVMAHKIEYISLAFVNIMVKDKGSISQVNITSDVVTITWSHSKLKEICTLFSEMSSVLQMIDFSFNTIETIQRHCFAMLTNIKLVLLNNNGLRVFKDNAFQKQQQLQKLDLSCNTLQNLEPSILSDIHLTVINISENNIQFIDEAIGQSLKVETVFSDDYTICCLLESVGISCSQKPIWPERCLSLFHSLFLRIVVFTQFCLIFGSNVVSFLIELSQHVNFKVVCWKRNSKRRIFNQISTFAVTIFVLSGNNLLFGLYLAVLFVANQRGLQSPVSLSKWLISPFCKVIGILSSFLVLNSIFILNLMATLRFVVVKYPFIKTFKGVRKVSQFLVLGFLATIALSILTFWFYSTIEEQSLLPFPTCQLLGETTHSTTIKCATLTVVALQIASCVSITFFYCAIVKELKSSELVHTGDAKRRQVVLTQAIHVSVGNAACWLPSSIIYLLSVGMETYPLDLLTFNTILIVPLNCILSPLFFSIVPFVNSVRNSKRKLARTLSVSGSFKSSFTRQSTRSVSASTFKT